MLNVREAWTDERLDDLNHKVDQLARRMDGGFGDLNSRLDGVQRTMIHLAGVIIAALVGLIATQLGLILTQI